MIFIQQYKKFNTKRNCVVLKVKRYGFSLIEKLQEGEAKS